MAIRYNLLLARPKQALTRFNDLYGMVLSALLVQITCQTCSQVLPGLIDADLQIALKFNPQLVGTYVCFGSITTT